VRHPLLWFGGAEMMIGLSALVTLVMFHQTQALFASSTWALPAGPVSTVVRFVLAFGILIVPTTMMGATLPLVVKSSLAGLEGLGRRVALLYASNTAGAVAGTVLAGFYLIGALGIAASFRVAVGLNLVAGAAAILMAVPLRRAQSGASFHRSPGSPPAVTRPITVPVPERARKLVLLVFTLSGFAALGLEVVWFRILVLFFEATTYAFAVMLAAVLCGIAAGSYAVAPLLRRRLDWLAFLAGFELAIGIFSALSLAAAHTHLAPWVEPIAGDLALAVVTSVLVVIPPTFLMGAAFPIGLRLCTEAGTRAGERVGFFYALNVCGAIVGSVAAGFFLLPRVGSRSSILVLAAVSVISGILLLRSLPAQRRGFKLAAGGVGLALFAATGLTAPDPFALAQAHRYSNETLLWREKSVQATVSVQVRPVEDRPVRILYLDGLHQANDSPEMVRVHRQIGHLALALHPNPRRAMVVGLGGGVTAGAASQHDSVRVEIVELSEAVARASTWFGHVSYDVLRRPNVRLHIDDGRNYLLRTQERYDVITADIIQPTHAGAGNLYSSEYFRFARRALATDGLMLQWVGHRPETHYKLIVRTFLSVFPDTTLWVDGTLMVGATRPLQVDPTAFDRTLRAPRTREALRAIGVSDLQALMALYTAGPEQLREFVGPGPILTDDRPMVEYFKVLPLDDRVVDLTELRGNPWRHVKH
jgi:spermidine synthase